MLRNQPPGFRWLVGGFALLAGCAFVLRFVTDADKAALTFGLICLVLAAYWLIFDREPPATGECADGVRQSGEVGDEAEEPGLPSESENG